jgi:ribosome maturation factor RimP
LWLSWGNRQQHTEEAGAVSTRDATRERIEAELAAPLGDLGLDLEAVELSSAGRRSVLRVAVDRDGGVTLDDVADATRAVSACLDSSETMGEQPYTLEVTSRGVDRPLTQPRHWRRNHDRLVRVTRTDGSVLLGRVVGHDEDPDGGAELLVEDPPQDGDAVRVPYAEVARALVQIEFNRRSQEGD